ncbi:MAG: hypothetical protein JW712_10500, partial [Dehalococcoidales bacterium]|nr:hypothetical protein [Dehalococcoidales bacterium]
MTVSKITNANMFRVLLHIIVVASLLIMLLPVAGSTASAESDNISEILLMPTDNVTVDVSFETRNTTEMTQDNHAEEKKVKEDKKEKKVKPVNTKEVDKHYFLVEPDKENKLELPSKKATLSIPK